MRTIADMVKQASANYAPEASNVMEPAFEQGINDANRVVKVASYTGDIMGNQAYETFHSRIAASLGFDPEVDVVKEASIKDLIDYTMYDSFVKIAESYSPQSGGAHLTSTIQAGADQMREEGKTHAMLAMQAAQDAVSSVDMGDANTAAQSIATAGQNITLAQQALQAVADPELEAQVAQASQIVAQAAQAIQAQA